MIRSFLRRIVNAPGWETAEKRLPKPAQCRKIFRLLTFREWIIAALAAFAILLGVSIFLGNLYATKTISVPSRGGSITIGVVGRPLYLNPVLAPSNPADSDLTELIFAGLYRYDRDGKLIPDLATNIAVGDFGRVVEVTLRNDLHWPDGEPFTADDVAFTINAIKNPNLRSPLFTVWAGVGLEVVDPWKIRFLLPAPYPPFPHNLTVGILPKHLWENIPQEQFSLTEQNLKPMGLGPFRPQSFERDHSGHILSYTLTRNDASPRQPFLDRVTLRFFESETDAIAAFNRREISFVTITTPENRETLRHGALLTSAALPRTFALFLNQTTTKALTDSTVRKALAYATNREPIIAALGGEPFAHALERPIPEGMVGATTETPRYDFAPTHAQNILDAAGWNKSDDGIRKKGDERLAFTLTLRDDPTTRRVGEILRDEWRVIGVALELNPLAPADYRRAVAERHYEVLLAGQELPLDPDPYAFWHSSQKFDPGANIALYENKKADTILEEARQDFDETSRARRYGEFQALLMEDAPAIFLWQERYVTAVDRILRNTETNFLANPSWRFGPVSEWYTKTKRVWK